MSSQQVCVIANVDSQVGYALAYRFLEGNRKHRGGNENQCNFRLLCRNKEGLDQLAHLGGDIRQVDYNREDQLREELKNAKVVIFVPEHDNQRVQQGENIIKAAKNENVNHLCMISILGVDKTSNDHQFYHLDQYRQLEQKVQEIMGGQEKSSIVRVGMLSQMFYCMAPSIEGHGTLRLPIKKDKKWSTVDLNEVVEAITKLAHENRQGNQGFAETLNNLVSGSGHQQKQLYQFTAHRNVSMEEMVQQISQGLGRKDIKYEQADREDIKRMLHELREDKRFKERPRPSQNDNNGGGTGSNGRQDSPSTFPLGRYLTDAFIDTILEFWELVNQGRMDIVTDDLKQILGRNPSDITSFFKNNRDQFRDLR
ncbi:hypothetical protein BCR42DRAFT_490737 [Absidia repens]|uniref:NmrA-like domain-containing protein n=1 Tax=Absidia repens TaxID=90262 RepID=A0A1X2IKQ1_9FUNG|nr:hypothetical protein BCR42DRAFT_490737 [Absidia repens]